MVGGRGDRSTTRPTPIAAIIHTAPVAIAQPYPPARCAAASNRGVLWGKNRPADGRRRVAAPPVQLGGEADCAAFGDVLSEPGQRLLRRPYVARLKGIADRAEQG